MKAPTIYRLAAILGLGVVPVGPASAQAAAPVAAVAPVEHRLAPDEIDAAEAEGAERNHAAELLAMTRGEPSLALTGEKRKPQVHGEVGFGIGSNGGREVFGAATTTLDNGTTVSVAGDYTQYGRTRYRTR